MSDLNQFTCTGRLGGDPETRRFQSGDPVVNFNLAIGEAWRDKNTGEKKERTLWMPVKIINRGLCNLAEQYLRKGSRLALSGQLQSRSYEKDGQKIWVTELVLGPFNASLVMLDGNSNGTSEQRQSEYTQTYRPAQDHMTQNTGSNGPSGYGGGSAPAGAMGDDSIPFAPEWRI